VHARAGALVGPAHLAAGVAVRVEPFVGFVGFFTCFYSSVALSLRVLFFISLFYFFD
jgi:hypothetical protein